MWGQIAGIISFILEVVGKWKVGNRKKCGFLIKGVGSLAWLITGLLAGVIGLTLASVVGFGLNMRNYLKWRRDEAA